MTDSPDLSAQHEAVRRLLAEARHEEPTPPEVAARLDATLVELLSERSAPQSAPVIDLGARRRRLASFGVLAAAAVLVAGVALGQAIPPGSNDSASVADGDGSAQSGGGGQADSSDAEALEGSARSKGLAPEAIMLPEIDLGAGLEQSLLALRDAAPSDALAPGAALAPCEVGDIGKGSQVLVEIAGDRGLVLFKVPQGPRQRAEVFVCGDAEPVGRLWLPSP